MSFIQLLFGLVLHRMIVFLPPEHDYIVAGLFIHDITQFLLDIAVTWITVFLSCLYSVFMDYLFQFVFTDAIPLGLLLELGTV